MASYFIDIARCRTTWPFASIICLAGLFATTDASAADQSLLPARSTAPAYDWSGVYVGGHVGYFVGNSDWTANSVLAASPTLSGSTDIFDRDGPWGPMFGGLQAGYNYVFPSHLMLGFEADASFPNHLNSLQTISSAAAGQYTTADKVEFFGTVRGRVGYAFQNWLIYATGGFAYDRDLLSRIQNAGTPVGGTAGPGDEDDQFLTRFGWTLGLGAEIGLSPNWSAKFEYKFLDFGSRSVVFPLAAQQYDSNLLVQSLQAGLNYHFGRARLATTERRRGA